MMRKIFYALLFTSFVTALYIWIRPKKIPVEVYEVKYGPFVESFSTNGRVRAHDKKIVYAFANGSIGDLIIKAGDLVTKNQLIGTLDWDRPHLIKAPMDGVVSKVFRDAAGPVSRGEPLFEVSSLADLEIIVDVLTADASRLRVNGEVWIQNWGENGDLESKIIQISRAGTVKISALGVEEERAEVKIALNKVPQRLKNRFGDNYHVDVLFVVSREANVLSVPLGALFKSDNQWAVYILQDGRAKLRTVDITKKNDRFALVVSGLSEGDSVILFPGDRIHEGSLVKRL